jgi:hypothetical protein
VSISALLVLFLTEFKSDLYRLVLCIYFLFLFLFLFGAIFFYLFFFLRRYKVKKFGDSGDGVY